MNTEDILVDRIRILEGLISQISSLLSSPFPPEAILGAIAETTALVTLAMPNGLSREEDLATLCSYFPNCGEELTKRIQFASMLGPIGDEKAKSIFEGVRVQFLPMLARFETTSDFIERVKTNISDGKYKLFCENGGDNDENDSKP